MNSLPRLLLHESFRAIEEVHRCRQVSKPSMNRRIVRIELRDPHRSVPVRSRKRNIHPLLQPRARRVNERVAQALPRTRHVAEQVVALVLEDQRNRICAVELELIFVQNPHLVLVSQRDQVLSGVEEPRILPLTAPARAVEHPHLRRYVEIGRILREACRLEELRPLEQREDARRDAEEEVRQESTMVGKQLISVFTLQRDCEQTLRLGVTRSLQRHV